MDVYFVDEYLEALFQGIKPKGKPVYQEAVILKFKKTVIMMSNCSRMEGLWQFKSLNFEALGGDKKGLFSVRVDRQYRLEFSIDRVMEGEKVVKDIVHIISLSNHYA